MEMIPRGDNFKLTLNAQDLMRGLRPSKRSIRNAGYMIKCMGAVGRDGALQILDQLDAMDLTAITDGFPYPQVFVFPNMIIVCGKTKIYEWINSALVLKLTVTTGNTWEAIASGEYVYLSNGKVAVVRDSADWTYALSDLPVASCICNFNGQVLIGAPGEDSSS